MSKVTCMHIDSGAVSIGPHELAVPVSLTHADKSHSLHLVKFAMRDGAMGRCTGAGGLVVALHGSVFDATEALPSAARVAQTCAMPALRADSWACNLLLGLHAREVLQ